MNLMHSLYAGTRSFFAEGVVGHRQWSSVFCRERIKSVFDWSVFLRSVNLYVPLKYCIYLFVYIM